MINKTSNLNMRMIKTIIKLRVKNPLTQKSNKSKNEVQKNDNQGNTSN